MPHTQYGARMSMNAEDEFRVGTGPQPSVPRKRGTTKFVVMGIAAAVALVLGGLAVVLFAAREPVKEAAQKAFQSPLLTAKAKCAPSSVYAQVGDGGDSLTLQSEGKEDPGITYNELGCFWTELKVTDAIRSEMESTRALDGKQAGDWGDYHASWSYHPDSGFTMIVTVK